MTVTKGGQARDQLGVLKGASTYIIREAVPYQQERREEAMALPSISVINFAPTLDDRDIQNAIRAVNRQVLEDFAPIWAGAHAS